MGTNEVDMSGGGLTRVVKLDMSGGGVETCCWVEPPLDDLTMVP